MPLIYVDPNTLRITVSTSLDEAFVPSEKTIAIKKFAEHVKKEQQKFIEEQYNPLIDRLMAMVMEYNAEFNPEIAKNWEAKKKELAKKREAAKKGDQGVKPGVKLGKTKGPVVTPPKPANKKPAKRKKTKK